MSEGLCDLPPVQVAINGERPWVDPDCPEPLRRLITKCWHQARSAGAVGGGVGVGWGGVGGGRGGGLL